MSTSILEDKPLSEASQPELGVEGEAVLETLINPMRLPSKQLLLMRLSPRCGARTRLGTPCQGPATKGKRRCRLHGGANGSGAPEGTSNGNYRHGMRTRKHQEELRRLRDFLRQARNAVEAI